MSAFNFTMTIMAKKIKKNWMHLRYKFVNKSARTFRITSFGMMSVKLNYLDIVCLV